MLGKQQPSWCPICRGIPGPDCPDYGRNTRSRKVYEKRMSYREIAEIIGEDLENSSRD